MTATYLPAGLPAPEPGELDAPFWQAAARGELAIQRCRRCRTWRWGPEWICHVCHAFEYDYEPVAPIGRVRSWTRVWHPIHPALRGHGPYLVAVIELPAAGGVRLIGNLLGDPLDTPTIGSAVGAEFEAHESATGGFTLVQWRR